MTVRAPGARLLLFASLLLTAGCNGEDGGGKRLYAVEAVIDGDTIDLDDGRRIRLLGIDAPERGTNAECWGDEALNHLSSLIGSTKVSLEYDVEREDDYGRTLAWVHAGDVFVNAKMVEDGAACVLIIPPNGAEFESYLETLESGAQAANRGLWGACGGCDTPEAFR